MLPDFHLSLIYPDGKKKPPVCESKDVLEAYGRGMPQRGQSYMAQSVQWRRKESRSGGNQPIHLYKYRQFNANDVDSKKRVRDILVRDKIWMAGANSLNDLHDLQGFNSVKNPGKARLKEWVQGLSKHTSDMSYAEQLELQEKLIREPLPKSLDEVLRAEHEQLLGVFCASEDPRNEPMWAHYAGDHRGICVQFDTTQDELFLLVEKVQYSKQYPEVMVPSNPARLDKHYLHKSQAWEYEREWRVAFPRNRLSVQLRPSTISGVIFGARATTKTVEAVKSLLAERRGLDKPAFKLYRADRNKDRYGVAIRCMK